MNTDDIVKVMIAISLSFSMVILAISVARMFFKVGDLVDDVSKPVKEFGELSEEVVGDYKSVKYFLTGLLDFNAVFGRIMGIFQRKRNTED